MSHTPTKLVLSHLGGPNSVVFADATTQAAIYVVNINQSSDVEAGNWFFQPTASLLANPPTLPQFDEATPSLTTISFGTKTIRNTIVPFKVPEDPSSKKDTIRFGFITKTENGPRFYALGFIPSEQFGKFHWVVDVVLHKSLTPQNVMNPNDDVIQFKLVGMKSGLFGAKPATLATFTTSKSVEGLGGVFELYRAWVDEEEAVLILSSVVAAFLAYKYRVQAMRHQEINGTKFSNTGKDVPTSAASINPMAVYLPYSG
ncbi:hypothetical protein BCR33DRAFT_735539 [Rhizoclosmatium globosum]|uniref:Uncharacterized protein n=1 Tax=Rhizoclosmatium globosum TaxID=329046 RepID=A0A1Y2CQU9_9FUNG|nr:hypothetical protein BCR33DRAFT_735539 [Rhizoclosmatium globosum]|eukprot:ORY48735.1 hypothetical protein BCR33DRAFT_735539 [Rhizoclosmatium globosum]